MKKFRKIMAILVAAVMIVAMAVPAWAALDPDTDPHGTLGTETGTITIKNVQPGETYTVWRMFELASFVDTDTAAGVHIKTGKDEAYSYVISEKDPWYGWLTTGAGKIYAQVIASGNSESDYTLTDKQYFWIQSSKVSVNSVNDYHIIYATDKFKNSADLPTTDNQALDPTTDYLTGDAKTIQEFAQAAVKAAAGFTFTGDATSWAPVHNAVADDDDDIEIPTLPLGYYLVGSTQGTLCSLDTTNTDVDIYDKNQGASLDPAVGKHVLNKGVPYNTSTPWSIADGAAGWVKNRDAKIGDVVYFRTEITAKQGAKNYVLHDVMEPGLTFDGVTTNQKIEKVTLKQGSSTPVEITATANYDADGEGEGAAIAKTNWTLYSTGTGLTAPTGGCDFQIKFADERLYTDTTEYIIKDNDKITVYYSAKVSRDAVSYGSEETDDTDMTEIKTTGPTGGNSGTKIDELDSPVGQVSKLANGDQRNTNYTILTYGANQVTQDDFSKATVTVYQFDIVKTRQAQDPAATEHTLLKDAVFKLYKATTTVPTASTADKTQYAFGTNYYKDGDALSFIYDSTDNTYKYNGYADTTDETDEITSLDDTVENLNGLDVGNYLLFEETAPIGFHKLANPILITINGGNINGTSETNESKITYILKDNNNKLSTAATKVWSATVDGTDPVTYDSEDEFGTGEDKYKNGGVEIINVAGQELPSTGGMGTTVLYIVGGMLVILAGAYLFFSRKKVA